MILNKIYYAVYLLSIISLEEILIVNHTCLAIAIAEVKVKGLSRLVSLSLKLVE